MPAWKLSLQALAASNPKKIVVASCVVVVFMSPP
jgi:hypothetical protein